MDAFVLMKQYISSNLIDENYINNLVLKDSKRIDLTEKALPEFKEKKPLFFKFMMHIDMYNRNINSRLFIFLYDI